jgi:hypothetical protein
MADGMLETSKRMWRRNREEVVCMVCTVPFRAGNQGCG